MPLENFGSVLNFAEELESQDQEFYEAAAGNPACSDHKQMFEQFAANAKKNDLFTELVPTPATRFVRQDNGTYKKETFIQSFDDGIRETTTIEALAGLNPVFAAGGSVTAGNSSQTTDGAAASA